MRIKSTAKSDSKSATAEETTPQGKSAGDVAGAGDAAGAATVATVDRETRKGGGGRRWLAVVLTGLVMGAVVGVGYVWQLGNVARIEGRVEADARVTRWLERLQEDVDGFQGGEAWFGREVEYLRERVEENEEEWQEETEALRREMRVLEAANTELRAQVQEGGDRWRVLEAEALVQAAVQQTQLFTDARMARVALEMADARLARLNNTRWDGAREVLARDIVALTRAAEAQARREARAAAILGGLSRLATEVANLPLAGEGDTLRGARVLAEEGEATNGESDATNGEGDAEERADENWAMRLVRSVLADLRGLVEVERRETVPAALYVADMRWLTMERVRLMLEAAKLAFLRGQVEVFVAVLGEVEGWVRAEFAGGTTEVQDWLGELEGLVEEVVGEEGVEAVVPDISESLRVVRAAGRLERRGG